MKFDTYQDVVDQIIPLAPSLTERDIADIVILAHDDPAGAELLFEGYKAADPSVPPDIWAEVWRIIQTAAQVAGIVTAFAGLGGI